MAKNYLSIDFGTKNLRLAIGSLSNNSFLVERLYSIPTPRNSYLDGKIVSRDLLSKAVKELVEGKTSKLKDIAITINSSHVITRELILPYVNSKEMDSMIRYEIMQQLPIEMDLYAVEYKLLEEFVDNNVKKNRILVAAMPKIIVEDFFYFIRDLELNPIAMNINPNALSRLIDEKTSINEKAISDETIAIIDIGHSLINISIIANSMLTFSRTINQGGKDIDSALAAGLNKSLEEVEEEKLSFSLLSSHGYAGNLHNEVVLVINRWLLDIRRMLQFYESRSSNRISKIYLYGGSSKVKGLAEHIADVINLPVEVIKAVSSIKEGKALDDSKLDISDYLNAIGSIPKGRQVK